jgi:hypothetical protein
VDILGRTAALWATDSGQDGFKDFFSQDKQCSERSDTGPSDSGTSALSDALGPGEHAEGVLDLSPGWGPATAGRNPGY